MPRLAFFNFALAVAIFFAFSSCTIYTEKRSEELSQAVFATANSIDKARFDLAYKYSKQAQRVAYAPKHPIDINSIVTEEMLTVTSENKSVKITSQPNNKKDSVISANVINTTDKQSNKTTILRLVVPEHLKYAKLLIENSEEWNELLKTTSFANQLKLDNENLERLNEAITLELERQQKMKDQMVQDLNNMKTKLAEKDAAIWIRNSIIIVLILILAGLLYLNMKGIL